ncbi:MAG TPA: hypothetical protein VLJ18_06505 [Thermoanaerobaculia bacterium]|nr:hypothetical protein [Thermoanaerobaculia bacterium]
MSDDPLFRGLEPPAVPAHLKEDALAAARAALAAAPRRDPWARLLASPAARLAWAASVAALAAAHVLLPRAGRPEAPAAAAKFTRPDPELASITRLPRIDEHALPAPEGDRS